MEQNDHLKVGEKWTGGLCRRRKIVERVDSCVLVGKAVGGKGGIRYAKGCSFAR